MTHLMVQLFRELLSFMLEDPRTISRAICLTFIAKCLERIADHATNIAELVVYLLEGKIIRHTTPQDLQGRISHHNKFHCRLAPESG